MDVGQASPQYSLQMEGLEPQGGQPCLGTWVSVVRSKHSLMSAWPEGSPEDSDFFLVFFFYLFKF